MASRPAGLGQFFIGTRLERCHQSGMKTQSITLVQLAELAGVSVSTVSRSLTGHEMISVATRERILALAKTHGFQINQAARNLRLKRTGAIGVVIPMGHETEQSVSDPFFMSLLGCLADDLAKRSYELLLTRVIPKDDNWLEPMFYSGRVDGVIVIGQSDQMDVIEQVSSQYQNIVVWGAAMPGGRQITVGSDNLAGGRLAAEHLLNHGRSRLAFFGNPDVPEFAARLEGFREAIASRGADPATVFPVHLTTEASYSAIASFLAANSPPDGIFAASDVVAMSALRALAEAGLRVPQDVSVIGYDDILIASFTSPPLTTLRQDVAEGATLLVDLLFRRMNGETVEAALMAPKMILRDSA